MKILAILVVPFIFIACNISTVDDSDDINDKTDKILSDLDKRLEKLKVTYKPKSGMECDIEIVESGKKAKVFYLSGLHPSSQKLVHDFYTPKEIKTDKTIIKNGVSHFFMLGDTTLLLNTYSESGDQIYTAKKFKGVDISRDSYKTTYTNLVSTFDAKTNEIKGQLIKTTEASDNSPVLSVKDIFIIDNCIETEKMIMQMPKLN